MTLLRDSDLGILSTTGVIKDLPPNAGNGLFDDSIQASSVDLHIGKIFTPGKLDANGEPIADSWCSLGQGHTVVVETKEELDMPPDLAAIGFPPSRVSSRGLLVTNPGHVDPGYAGTMRFTVINIAKTAYELREGAEIVSLLFFKLASPVAKDWRTRRNSMAHSSKAKSTKETLSRLPLDFLDVTERANTAALKHVGLLAAMVAILVVAIPAFVGVWASTSDIEKRLTALESEPDDKIAQRISQLESELKGIRTTLESRVRRSK